MSLLAFILVSFLLWTPTSVASEGWQQLWKVQSTKGPAEKLRERRAEYRDRQRVRQQRKRVTKDVTITDLRTGKKFRLRVKE